tara:strand:+ start:480 stop:746 length:267 start_codon:yes stop_codon:yes gene_type:complete
MTYRDRTYAPRETVVDLNKYDRWIETANGREAFRYRIRTDLEFFNDDIAKNDSRHDAMIVELDNAPAYLEDDEVLEIAEALARRRASL